MKIFVFDDDPRKINDHNYFQNKGSFAVILDNLRAELEKLNLAAKSPEEADWVVFSTSTKLDFGFANKNRACIQAWESNSILPYFIQFVKAPNYKLIGLSKQVQDNYAILDINIPIVDIGVDTKYYKPQKNVKKNEKFTILSVTSCNFRSGINHTLLAFEKFAADKKGKVKLIIKNTDERAKSLPRFCDAYRQNGYDVEYICERLNMDQVRELYAKSHVLCYNPIITSAGLCILEAAAMQLPCLVGNYCPTNIYPYSEAIKCTEKNISDVKSYLCDEWSLPYTFPQGWVNDFRSKVYWLDENDFSEKLNKLYSDYDSYLIRAKNNRKVVLNKWTWGHSVKQLLDILSK